MQRILTHGLPRICKLKRRLERSITTYNVLVFTYWQFRRLLIHLPKLNFTSTGRPIFIQSELKICKYFGISRYGTWSKCQFFSPTVKLDAREHSVSVNHQIIRLIQFSCNCAFLDKKAVMQKVGVTTFLHSINVTRESNLIFQVLQVLLYLIFVDICS